MPTDLVVVYSPVGGGHKAAALAVVEAARARGLSVEAVDAFEHAPRLAGDAYLAAHLAGQSATPELYGRMYFASNRRGDALEPLRLRFDALVFADLRDRIAASAPRAVIATHHLPLVVLGRERRKRRLHCPVVGVVTDYIAHACWAERGVTAWAVPFGRARADMIGHGVPPSRIVTTGIPVKSAFERVPDIVPPRAPNGAVRVLVTSGGFGVGPLARIVRSFADVANAELTVVCGKAPGLVERVRREAGDAGVAARVIGFEKDMPARLAEAHVVVGKAGGLTVTEAMTAGRPMVIVGAVPGNEAVNEVLVTDGGAGVAASPDDVGVVVSRLRADGSLGPMGARARALVPTGAADAVIDVALRASRRSSRAA
jgi:processive 1,2-diacylglycerol beta-glucosyltransferase